MLQQMRQQMRMRSDGLSRALSNNSCKLQTSVEHISSVDSYLNEAQAADAVEGQKSKTKYSPLEETPNHSN